MNRTDRLYALVEELRASAPRRRSARELAALYEVSVRTIERDIGALQQAGVPIYADVGRTGGYTLDKERTLPPVNFTASEAVALAICLGRAGDTLYAQAARTALNKILSVMPAADNDAARDLASRIRFSVPAEDDDVPEPPVRPARDAVLEEAMVSRRVVRISYVDRHGSETDRDVEPQAFTAAERGWYLLAWCRLRGETRVFRLDRVRRAVPLEEIAPHRSWASLGDPPKELRTRVLELA
ncbi:helix-turn-helix transcriptional regulator [Actinomadura rupiterrae]|uniref:helix-turn-helix transcriptional regulator n=1 Tax=Actinomadura rupiterrae TaxID=559627 RepID=UPI0020A3112E|nr:YafY family protein [Actinomadura rupiterrae]MCP2335731.1 putative DNA-binding transcriptional regulator YafY [Actinomadura rupiterrae]